MEMASLFVNSKNPVMILGASDASDRFITVSHSIADHIDKDQFVSDPFDVYNISLYFPSFEIWLGIHVDVYQIYSVLHQLELYGNPQMVYSCVNAPPRPLDQKKRLLLTTTDRVNLTLEIVDGNHNLNRSVTTTIRGFTALFTASIGYEEAIAREKFPVYPTG